MTWRERQQFWPENAQGQPELAGRGTYERAKFKDAAFWVESYMLDGGRRLSIQKFPGSVYTNVQDLGRDSSRITVHAFFVGPDYDSELRALESRLLEGGPGLLRLPWRDPFTVTVVGRILTDESKNDRGFASITFECVETAPPPPFATVDTAGRVRQSAQNAKKTTRRRFGERFSVANQPDSRRTKIRDVFDKGVARIVDIRQKVTGFIAEIPRAANRISRLTSEVNRLIATPLDLADEIDNAVYTAFSAFRTTATTASLVLETWGRGGPIRVLSDQVFRFDDEFTPEAVMATTEAGRIEQQNLTNLNRLFRLFMFYQMADLLTELPFESRGQAISLRADFVRAIDDLLLDSNDLERRDILALNQSVGAFLEQIAGSLPEVATYTLPGTQPALVAAWTIYGDARRGQDIVIRNSLRHPGFVPGGEPLEVIGA